MILKFKRTLRLREQFLPDLEATYSSYYISVVVV